MSTMTEPLPTPSVSGPSTQSQDRAVLLPQVDHKIEALREDIAKLKPNRWISIRQAVLVAATVPLSAGVFWIYAEQGNREIEIYELSLAHVDRAADLYKDVRYRQTCSSWLVALSASPVAAGSGR